MKTSGLAEILSYLEETRVGLRAAVDAAPRADRERKPAPDRWSVAEVIEHLAIVENRVTARLGEALEQGRAAGVVTAGGPVPALDRDLLAHAGDRTGRFKTSPPAEPRGGLDTEAAWSTLETSRQAFERLLHRANGLDVSGIVAPHPFFGPLSFYQWAVFLGAHDTRHASQIREIAVELAAAD